MTATRPGPKSASSSWRFGNALRATADNVSFTDGRANKARPVSISNNTTPTP